MALTRNLYYQSYIEFGAIVWYVKTTILWDFLLNIWVTKIESVWDHGRITRIISIGSKKFRFEEENIYFFVKIQLIIYLPNLEKVLFRFQTKNKWIPAFVYR